MGRSQPSQGLPEFKCSTPGGSGGGESAGSTQASAQLSGEGACRVLRGVNITLPHRPLLLAAEW